MKAERRSHLHTKDNIRPLDKYNTNIVNYTINSALLSYLLPRHVHPNTPEKKCHQSVNIQALYLEKVEHANTLSRHYLKPVYRTVIEGTRTWSAPSSNIKAKEKKKIKPCRG